MNDFEIKYNFENHGWATICLKCEEQEFLSSVSYLHDSLGDLAQMAIDLRSGKEISKSLFMGEPGELLLVVKIENNEAICEGRWYNDWASWGMYPEDKFDVVVIGSTSKDKLIKDIKEILIDIHNNIGIKEYRQRWIEHDFPSEKLAVLLNS